MARQRRVYRGEMDRAKGGWIFTRVRVPLPWLVVFILAFLAVWGCAKKPVHVEFPYTLDKNFSMENPSRYRAATTGIGCGGSRKDALSLARKHAHFNLRGVTGPYAYRIRYRTTREIPNPGKICMEVKARAVP